MIKGHHRKFRPPVVDLSKGLEVQQPGGPKYNRERWARMGVFRKNLRLLPQCQCSQLIARMVTILHLSLYLQSLQRDFGASPSQKWNLSPQLLKLVWLCDWLWLIEQRAATSVWFWAWTSRAYSLFYVFFRNPATTAWISPGYPAGGWEITCRRAQLTQRKSS